MKKHPTSSILCAASLFVTAAVSSAGTGTPVKSIATPMIEEDIVVHPVTSPYFHEDSFITTDIRPIFVYHTLPGDFLGGGNASVTAMQIRIKLTKSLQLVAYKDGWTDVSARDFGGRGWNDLAAGIKWAFYQNDAAQLHSAIGLGYEFASGDDNALQDDDELRAWISLNKGFGKLHLGATLNYSWAMGNGNDILGDSDWLSWHFHADYQVCNWFSPFIEFNGYHTTRGLRGQASASPMWQTSATMVTKPSRWASGVELRPLKWLALRTAYELALLDKQSTSMGIGGRSLR